MKNKRGNAAWYRGMPSANLKDRPIDQTSLEAYCQDPKRFRVWFNRWGRFCWELIMPEREIEEVLKEHAGEIMALPGVVGIGKGELRGSPCIMVFVVEKNAEVLRKIPNSIESYPVQVKESGQFRARTGLI